MICAHQITFYVASDFGFGMSWTGCVLQNFMPVHLPHTQLAGCQESRIILWRCWWQPWIILDLPAAAPTDVNTMEIADAIEALRKFTGDALTQTIANVEAQFGGLNAGEATDVAISVNATDQSLVAAATIKIASAQIDTAIHAIGILRCLEHMLEDGEVIEYLSLGAGNTNRRFDLETDLRVAEFKFINWQGGSESIRQNSLFKDFANLAEYETGKVRQMCVLGDHHPLAFFSRRRALTSVCKENPDLLALIDEKYPDMTNVNEYYDRHCDRVSIVDVSDWVPELRRMAIDDGGSETKRPDVPRASTVQYLSYTVTALEDKTIIVSAKGINVPAMPELRKIAKELGVSLLNGNGNAYNTRQLGSHVIAAIERLNTG